MKQCRRIGMCVRLQPLRWGQCTFSPSACASFPLCTSTSVTVLQLPSLRWFVLFLLVAYCGMICVISWPVGATQTDDLLVSEEFWESKYTKPFVLQVINKYVNERMTPDHFWQSPTMVENQLHALHNIDHKLLYNWHRKAAWLFCLWMRWRKIYSHHHQYTMKLYYNILTGVQNIQLHKM